MGNQASTLRQAAAEGDIAKVISLATPELVDSQDQDGWSALHYAVLKSNGAVAKELIARGATVGLQDKAGRSPLHVAAVSGHERLITILCEAGAHVNATDADGLTALHKAAAAGLLDAVKCLVNRGADVNACNTDGCSPLHLAVESGHLRVADVLIAAGADTELSDGCGWRALHHAAAAGRQQCVLLLMAHGADTMATNKDGHSAGWLALQNRHTNTVQVLEPALMISEWLLIDTPVPSQQPVNPGATASTPHSAPPDTQQPTPPAPTYAASQPTPLTAPYTPHTPAHPSIPTVPYYTEATAAPPPPTAPQAQPTSGGIHYPSFVGAPPPIAPSAVGTSVAYPAMTGYLPSAPPLEDSPTGPQHTHTHTGAHPGPSPPHTAVHCMAPELTISQIFGAHPTDVVAEAAGQLPAVPTVSHHGTQRGQPAGPSSGGVSAASAEGSGASGAQTTTQQQQQQSTGSRGRYAADLDWGDSEASEDETEGGWGAPAAQPPTTPQEQSTPSSGAPAAPSAARASASSQATAARAPSGADAQDADLDWGEEPEAEEDGWGAPSGDVSAGQAGASSSRSGAPVQPASSVHTPQAVFEDDDDYFDEEEEEQVQTAQHEDVQAVPSFDVDSRIADLEARLDRKNGWIRGGTAQKGGSSDDQVVRQQMEINFLKQQLDQLRLRQQQGAPVESQHIYSYQELYNATNGFADANRLGQGGYGCVYRGVVQHTPVAVKVLDAAGIQSRKQFEVEVDILSRVRHPHVLLLLGSCPEGCCLVYELMENGSLEDYLKSDKASSLTWAARLKIALDVSTALLHLHCHRPHPILHHDIKPANILLDASLSAKLADVGLARLAPELSPLGGDKSTVLDSRPLGTLLYADPVYLQTGQYSRGSDVYSLGVVLLQLVTGRSDSSGIIQMVEAAVGGQGVRAILDGRIRAAPMQEVMAFAHLGLQCTRYYRQQRPDLDTTIVPTLTQLYHNALTAAYSASPPAKSAPEPPSIFVCPITQDVMIDPVVAADGYTYEREAIVTWLHRHNTSPLTNLPLTYRQVTPNFTLRSAIQEWREAEGQ